MAQRPFSLRSGKIREQGVGRMRVSASSGMPRCLLAARESFEVEQVCIHVFKYFKSHGYARVLFLSQSSAVSPCSCKVLRKSGFRVSKIKMSNFKWQKLPNLVHRNIRCSGARSVTST